MPDILHTLALNVTPDRVWPALTTFDGIRRWWTIGETVLAGDISLGGEFEFRSRQVVTRMKVVECREPSHVAWLVVDSNAPGGWQGTSVTFDLLREGHGTRLEFAHRAFATDNEGFRRVTAGWAHYLQNLKLAFDATSAK